MVNMTRKQKRINTTQKILVDLFVLDGADFSRDILKKYVINQTIGTVLNNLKLIKQKSRGIWEYIGGLPTIEMVERVIKEQDEYIEKQNQKKMLQQNITPVNELTEQVFSFDPKKPKKKKKKLRLNTTKQRVFSILDEQESTRIFSAQEISDIFFAKYKYHANLINNILYELQDGSHIDRVGYGMYRRKLKSTEKKEQKITTQEPSQPQQIVQELPAAEVKRISYEEIEEKLKEEVNKNKIYEGLLRDALLREALRK
jgi:hypothetical protein